MVDIKIKENEPSGYMSHNKPFGPGSRRCRACHTHKGIIRTYGLNLCRRCFPEYANDIGFKKYD
ncbi:putative ribosomal protein S29 [Hamiltosporidium tvaerminnensis]|uniref:Putative ribosomal protein S29 n=1 Tax=Hamiltosporidium tvaerminnensis TaxID=1176355 RepID=A0A4Q9L195_9MICR|nr:putative ribosomal protein S29 [Hamiltosporidium tvaerminnensis]TBU12011.1 putative ribosomal protein S29 [Hamiltosporidium tvaerminnensis]